MSDPSEPEFRPEIPSALSGTPDDHSSEVIRGDPFHEGAEAARARRLRSWAIAIALLLFVALTFAVTIAKVGVNAHNAGY